MRRCRRCDAVDGDVSRDVGEINVIPGVGIMVGLVKCRVSRAIRDVICVDTAAGNDRYGIDFDVALHPLDGVGLEEILFDVSVGIEEDVKHFVENRNFLVNQRLLVKRIVRIIAVGHNIVQREFRNLFIKRHLDLFQNLANGHGVGIAFFIFERENDGRVKIQIKNRFEFLDRFVELVVISSYDILSPRLMQSVLLAVPGVDAFGPGVVVSVIDRIGQDRISAVVVDVTLADSHGLRRGKSVNFKGCGVGHGDVGCAADVVIRIGRADACRREGLRPVAVGAGAGHCRVADGVVVIPRVARAAVVPSMRDGRCDCRNISIFCYVGECLIPGDSIVVVLVGSLRRNAGILRVSAVVDGLSFADLIPVKAEEANGEL